MYGVTAGPRLALQNQFAAEAVAQTPHDRQADAAATVHCLITTLTASCDPGQILLRYAGAIVGDDQPVGLQGNPDAIRTRVLQRVADQVADNALCRHARCLHPGMGQAFPFQLNIVYG